MTNNMFYEWPACLALDSNTIIYFIQGCVKRLFHRPLRSYLTHEVSVNFYEKLMTGWHESNF